MFCANRVDAVTDYSEAVTQAGADGKMLFIVHLPGDFSTHSADVPEARVYQAISLDNQEVVELLNKHFVCTFKNVGWP